jgi:hypothetical protein
LLAYDWFDLCQSAAVGNYDHARIVLNRMRGSLQREGEGNMARVRGALLLGLPTEFGMAANPDAIGVRLYLRRTNESLSRLGADYYRIQLERANLHTLEGMLLLEQGVPSQAAEQFRQALPLYQLATGRMLALQGQPLAQSYLKQIPLAREGQESRK